MRKHSKRGLIFCAAMLMIFSGLGHDSFRRSDRRAPISMPSLAATAFLPTRAKAASPAPAPALPPVRPGLIESGPSSIPKVAITFDACDRGHGSRFDQQVWAVLMEKKVKATIFLGGKWMENHPAETRMIGKSELIEIGNHSYNHPDFRKLTDERVREQLRKTQALEWQLMGKQGRLFRFPYGSYDERSLKIAAELGLYAIQWSVVSGDPSPSVRARAMVREVLRQAKNGSIIIFHINGRGWHTAEALPAIIDGLRAKGLEPVTVSELLGLPVVHSSATGPRR